MSCRILLVDDHTVVREGLRLLLSADDDLDVIAEAENGRKAIELAAELHPDIVIMDVSMPDMNGVLATRRILEAAPDVRVLALSAHGKSTFITQMLAAGASGYLLKDSASGALLEAIHVVMNGQTYLSPPVASTIVKHISENAQSAPAGRLHSLTGKELELMQLLAENKTSKEAAALLGLNVKTVDARRRAIMAKLGVSGTADLTKVAIREGLTSLDF